MGRRRRYLVRKLWILAALIWAGIGGVIMYGNALIEQQHEYRAAR